MMRRSSCTDAFSKYKSEDKMAGISEKSATHIIFYILILFAGPFLFNLLPISAAEDIPIPDYNMEMKRDLLCLYISYPEYILNIEKDSNNYVYLITKSGKRILYDDRKVKGYDSKLSNPDIQDMLEQLYPLNGINSLMEENFDPGRVRVYPLLSEVYGNGRQKINSNLVGIRFGYQSCRFNGNNGASESLKTVAREVARVQKNNPGIYNYVFPVSGTFNYRVIAGTGRLSPHSFGIAIDLKSNKRDYWKWVSREEGQKRIASYPRELVQIFENNNFIWGGKWGHFDILHFEYRPEIINKARYFSSPPVNGKPWYHGVPCEDSDISRFIKIIDDVLG